MKTKSIFEILIIIYHFIVSSFCFSLQANNFGLGYGSYQLSTLANCTYTYYYVLFLFLRIPSAHVCQSIDKHTCVVMHNTIGGWSGVEKAQMNTLHKNYRDSDLFQGLLSTKCAHLGCDGRARTRILCLLQQLLFLKHFEI